MITWQEPSAVSAYSAGFAATLPPPRAWGSSTVNLCLELTLTVTSQGPNQAVVRLEIGVRLFRSRWKGSLRRVDDGPRATSRVPPLLTQPIPDATGDGRAAIGDSGLACPCGRLPMRSMRRGSCRREGAMRTPKTINHILRSQEPASAAPMPLSWRCQFCCRRFTDRTQLLEHLEAEQQRQEEGIVP